MYVYIYIYTYIYSQLAPAAAVGVLARVAASAQEQGVNRGQYLRRVV